MSLQQWLDNSWVRRTAPSAQHVGDLLAIADRQVADANLAGISAEGRFTHAYDAVRVLCEIVLHAAGFSIPKGERQHERTIESLKFTLDGEWTQQVDFFDRCRRQRNQSIYDRSGVVQRSDADDLLNSARRLRLAVRDWLRELHPELLAE